MRWAVSAILLMTAFGMPAAASDAVRLMDSPKEGTLLVSVPQLNDPHFVHSVILIIAYGADGAWGLIINRPTDISPDEVFPDLKGVEKLSGPVYFGGPVNRNAVLALLRSKSPLHGAQKIFDHIYFTADRQTVTDALVDRDPDETIRIYTGYAGWGPGQLDRELGRGDWILQEATPEDVYSNDPSALWRKIYERQEKIQIRGPVKRPAADPAGPPH